MISDSLWYHDCNCRTYPVEVHISDLLRPFTSASRYMFDDRPASTLCIVQKTVPNDGVKYYGTSCLFDHTFISADGKDTLPAISWITEAILLTTFW